MNFGGGHTLLRDEPEPNHPVSELLFYTAVWSAQVDLNEMFMTEVGNEFTRFLMFTTMKPPELTESSKAMGQFLSNDTRLFEYSS